MLILPATQVDAFPGKHVGSSTAVDVCFLMKKDSSTRVKAFFFIEKS